MAMLIEMENTSTWNCLNVSVKVIRGRQKTPISPAGRNQLLSMALLISILHALKSCQQTAAAFHAILCITERCLLTLNKIGCLYVFSFLFERY